MTQGQRFNGDLYPTWATPYDEQVAKNEGYDSMSGHNGASDGDDIFDDIDNIFGRDASIYLKHTVIGAAIALILHGF